MLGESFSVSMFTRHLAQVARSTQDEESNALRRKCRTRGGITDRFGVQYD
jgi:hypothetical protein